MTDNTSTPNKITTGYWLGPANVLVPDSISEVVDFDQCNMVDRDGQTTEMECDDNNVLSVEEYRNKYAIYNTTDGFWYYTYTAETTKPQIPVGYWVGPAGVLIPTYNILQR